MYNFSTDNEKHERIMEDGGVGGLGAAHTMITTFYSTGR